MDTATRDQYEALLRKQIEYAERQLAMSKRHLAVIQAFVDSFSQREDRPA